MANGEFAMIDRLLKPLARGFPGALDLVDDAALLRPPPGRQLVLAKDAIVENVHYLSGDPPGTVARKLLRQNLSDLAAMGAEPIGYLTAFGLPADLEEGWLEQFVAGLAEDQAEFGLSLIGGDTVSTSGPAFFTLTIVGSVPDGQALRRKGARPGDLIGVSGTLGDGALGLRVLKGTVDAPADAAEWLVHRYRVPQPRLALGQALRGLATACMDVSDGLLGDLRHILDASGVGALVHAEQVPLSRAAMGERDALRLALTGGDDYELLFTVPADRVRELTSLPTPVTIIGVIQAEPTLDVVDRTGRPLVLDSLSWTHF